MDIGMWVSNALAALGTGLGAVLKAALILVVGIVVATIVKNMQANVL